jgi:hypothetical protein
MRNLILSLLLAAFAMPGWAQTAPQAAPQKVGPGQDLRAAEKTERGWFFFENNKKKEPLPDVQPAPPERAPKVEERPKEDKCAKAATWTKECGFIDPGTDFDFQAKQRDELLVQMTMSQNDPAAVEQFQYYMRWVMGRASEVANLWAFNMVQNPELDPQTKQPISVFGLRMMTDVQKGQAKEMFKVLQEEGGMLVFFTKSDCQFCHAMVPSMKSISQDMGIPVRNAALDEKCMPDFVNGCLAGAAVQAPAQALQVTTVPSAFLYVRPNTWIRIATGLTDETTMKSRTFEFFSAYRAAMLKGVNNAQKGRPSVDFSFKEDLTGASAGVEKKEGAQIKLPDEGDIAKLLGKQ